MPFLRYSIILVLAFLLSPPVAAAAILAPDQALWLDKHNNTLVVRPEKSYPPFSFISSRPSIKPKGLAVDYLELIARKIDAQPTYLEAKSRASILDDLKAGKEGIVLALSENTERGDDFYFSEPFISIPAVIVVRKDYKRGDTELSLGDFTAKQVSVTDASSVMYYIQSNYQRIIIEPVSDDEVALQKLLLGEVDAAVMDLASLSYYTSQDMLSYVTVAGQTGFSYNLAFAVPKTMPDLQIILNAGLKEITPSERQIIKDRWITFPSQQKETRGILNLFLTEAPVWIGISILGAIIIMILLTSMIIHTRRHHQSHLSSIYRAKHGDLSIIELADKLKELESANSTLDENIQEIKSLEKIIQEKIDKMHD